jgi:hypothetical protein
MLVFLTIPILYSHSTAQVDPNQSWAIMANDPAWITVSPGGFEHLTDPIDHTIDVYVNNSQGQPVELLASDIWLDGWPVVIWCPGGVIADSSTYAPDPGHTTISGELHGGVDVNAEPGGCRDRYVDVVATGVTIEVLDLRIDSMDLNADGQVTVADFAHFAAFYNDSPCTGQHRCADYDENAVDPCVNLVDFVIFRLEYNASACP